jgi:hypothetical protein
MTHFDWAGFHEKKNVVFDVTVPGLVPISAVPFGDGRVLVAGVDLEGGPVCVLLDATEERPMPTKTESTKGTGRVWNHFPAHEFGGCWGVEHCASTRPGSSLVVGLGPFAVAVTASGLAVFDPCTEAPSRRVVQVIPCRQRPTSIGWALGAKWLMVTMGEWTWRIARAERTDELVAESLQPTDQAPATSQPTHDLPLKVCPRRSMREIADLVTRAVCHTAARDPGPRVVSRRLRGGQLGLCCRCCLVTWCRLATDRLALDLMTPARTCALE